MAEVPVTLEPRVEVVSLEQRPLSISEVKQSIADREKAINAVLEKGKDTYKLSDQDKDALSKAGSEKLAYYAPLFGRPAVYPDYATVKEQIEPFRKWTMIKKCFDKYKKETVKKEIEIRGWYSYTEKCTLRVLGTDQITGTREGTCMSSDPGKETATANTIQQQAQIRAFRQAVLAYLAMSDRFTDEEAADEKEKRSEVDGDDIPAPASNMPSRFGSEDKQSKCHFCGEYHILQGDPLYKHPEMKNEKGKPAWGHKDCYAATFKPTEKPSDSDSQESKQSIQGDDGDDAHVTSEAAQPSYVGNSDLITKIQELENKLVESDKTFKPLEVRKAFAGGTDLRTCTDDQLNNLKENLEAALAKPQEQVEAGKG